MQKFSQITENEVTFRNGPYHVKKANEHLKTARALEDQNEHDKAEHHFDQAYKHKAVFNGKMPTSNAMKDTFKKYGLR